MINLDLDQNERDKFVKDFFDSEATGSVLDIGAGGGPYREYLQSIGFSYTSQDFCQLNESLINEKKYAAIDVVSDATNIPLDSESFDFVLITEVIEHTPEPMMVIKEAARLTKFGGKVLVTAPTIAGAHQEPFWFYGGFTKHWYEYVSNKYNLELIHCDYNKTSLDNIFKMNFAILSMTMKGVLRGKVQLLPLGLLYLVIVVLSFMALTFTKIQKDKRLSYGLISVFKK